MAQKTALFIRLTNTSKIGEKEFFQEQKIIPIYYTFGHQDIIPFDLIPLIVWVQTTLTSYKPLNIKQFKAKLLNQVKAYISSNAKFENNKNNLPYLNNPKEINQFLSKDNDNGAIVLDIYTCVFQNKIACNLQRMFIGFILGKEDISLKDREDLRDKWVSFDDFVYRPIKKNLPTAFKSLLSLYGIELFENGETMEFPQQLNEFNPTAFGRFPY